MSGDYTRFTFDQLKRYSGVLMQQGRVQLDSDWNEEIDILRRRIRTTTLDILGPLGVPFAASPNAFGIGWIPSPPVDLSISPGRLYVDGIQIEAFAEDNATYNHQPFFPPQSPGFPPPPLPATGDAVVYLDVWDREITYIEDPELLDVALGGADTAARRQTVWQVRVEPMPDAACGMPVGAPPSAGRLTSRAIAPPAPDDPCILPPASGYRGIENRLYRIEVHNGGPLGTARFKWSRDNGTIVSAVRDIAVSGTQTVLTVNRIGRDQFLRFRAGDWVTVTDDHRELMGEPGEMALVVGIDEANLQIVLDRALPSGGQRPFGANAAEIAGRHTRMQRWDQTGATNPVDSDGLILTAAGPIPVEDGIEIEFSTDPAGGSFRAGDYWLIWARTATAQIDEFTVAPPRGIVHHYMQIAAINGLSGATEPAITDCRPPPQQRGDCCCTIIVRPGESIQAGIDALPAQGGCVCLKTGTHVIREPLRIARGSIELKAESPGTTVQSQGSGPVLFIGNPAGFRIEGIDVLGIDFAANSTRVAGDGVVTIAAAARVRISHCGMSATDRVNFIGIHAAAAGRLSVLSCRFQSLAGGILVRERSDGFEADENTIEIAGPEGEPAVLGVAYMGSPFPCRITRNAISGALLGILLNDQPFGDADSLADLSFVTGNIVVCPALPEGSSAAARPVAIDIGADYCRVSGNRVSHGDRFYVGIRVSGSFCEVSGNVVRSSRRGLDFLGPVAIQIGGAGPENPKPVLAGIIAGNALSGPQHGILCTGAANLVIEGNLIEALNGQVGFAIFGTRVSSSHVSSNRIGGAFAAALFSSGRQNCISSNDCRGGGVGITLFQEVGPRIAGNRLDQLDFWGIYAILTTARLDIVENRLVRCGIAMPNTAFAVGCLAVGGEAHISANEIMDTGSNGGEGATSIADYGIYGDLVLEARVEGNLVTYSNVFARDPQREDRALVMRGLFELSQGANELTLGFAIQIHGNKFIGNGRTALVELRQTQLSPQFFFRFERVSFDHNYCSHISAPVFTPGQGATVWLVGRRAIVMGNHIKSLARSFPSVNFNGMPGPFIGNVTSGGTVNHPDFPAPAADFNMIAS
ncbi:MAG: DUF6519 domain-containing protein [Beijerinckiaceae bacterium]